MKVAYELAAEAGSEQKWKQLAELATAESKFVLAQECLHKAQDFGGLLLLATSSGNSEMVQRLGDTASEAGKNNVAFMANFMLGNLEECLEILIRTNRLPEAAFFARTYLPSEIARVLPLWKTELAKVSEKAGQSLADPENYENLFPNFHKSLRAQKVLTKERRQRLPAEHYRKVPESYERKPLEELGDIELSEDEEEEKYHAAPSPAVLAATVAAAAATTTAETTFEKDEHVDVPVKKPEQPAYKPAVYDTAELEEELGLEMDGMKLDDVDTSDVQLDDEDLLED